MADDLDTPGGRLRWARERAGYQSATEFSTALRVNPVSYRAYENNQNGFARHAPDFADKLGVPAAWLIRGGPMPDIDPPQMQPNAKVAPPDAYPVGINTWPLDVPVVGTTHAADLELEVNGIVVPIERFASDTADVIAHVRRPPLFTQNRDVYALFVDGTSMDPRFEPGELVYVNPRRPAKIGDYVVIQLRDGGGHDGAERMTCSMIKRLVRKNGTNVELEQFNPPLRFSLPLDRVKDIHRVMRADEILTS